MTSRETEKLSFGELILELRKKKEWTVKDLIKRLEPLIGRHISPAYITRIEQYGEIPSPDLICIMADVLGHDANELLNRAKKIKIQRFDKNLEEKYRKAVGHYRVQRGGRRKNEPG